MSLTNFLEQCCIEEQSPCSSALQGQGVPPRGLLVTVALRWDTEIAETHGRSRLSEDKIAPVNM